MQMDDKIQTVDGIPVTSEKVGFEAEKLVNCGDCEKANPPNRLSCLYCGAALDLPAEVAAGIQFQPAEIEDWELGINIIGLGTFDPATVEAACRSVGLRDLLTGITTVDAPVPLARVRPEEADEITSRLVSAGLTVSLIDDRSMELDRPQV